MADTPDLQEKTLDVYNRLVKAWGYRPWKPRRDALRELISTMLSHRTTSQQEWASMERLWEQHGSWAAIAEARVEEIEAAIHGVNFPEPKARNIKRALEIIGERTEGKYDIEFLKDASVAEGMEWLTSLPGVGIKTASLVLLFNFHKEIMPVDTHVHRVSQRIGLIGAKTTPEQAHHDLLELLPRDPDVYWNFHVAMIMHGRNVCTWANPRCQQCVAKDICNYYLQRPIAKTKEAAGRRKTGAR